MKLYTEEQVREAIGFGYCGIDSMSQDEYINTLTPIELPSDEEIVKYMTIVWFADNMHRECFKLGAIWMKTQVLNQNK